MYRGFSSFVQPGEYVNEYYDGDTDREPVTVPYDVHRFSDEFFLKKFGVKARSSAIVCTRYYEQAKSYTGENGVVMSVSIPGNVKYSAIYSESVFDFLEVVIGLDAYSEDRIFSLLESLNYKCVSDINEVPLDFMGEVMLITRRYKIDYCD